MKKAYYRVGHYGQDEIILNSDTYNYGMSFDTTYNHLLDGYFNIATKIDLPVDFLIDINIGIALFGNVYLNQIEQAIVQDTFVDIYKVTNKDAHRGIVIPIKLLNTFIQHFDDENPFLAYVEGKYLWERYFEMVRSKVFNHLPTRKDSIFLFDNVSDCEFYIQEHKKGFGKIYEVEIIREEQLLKVDMNIFDEISLSITSNNLKMELFKYWDGGLSNTPRFEYLFQGECRLKSIS
ncbi:MAG: hypothetical protein K9G41_09765 [Flavobacteriales bacterium]|nr:hypothetical protein [Flavobacteriales bacterium]